MIEPQTQPKVSDLTPAQYKIREFKDDSLPPFPKGIGKFGTIAIATSLFLYGGYVALMHGCHAITGDPSYIRRNNNLVPRYTNHDAKPLRTTDGNALIYHLSDGTTERYSFEENVDKAYDKLTYEVNKNPTPSSTREQCLERKLELLR